MATLGQGPATHVATAQRWDSERINSTMDPLNTPNPLIDCARNLAPALQRIDDYLTYWALKTPGADAAIEGEQCLTYDELQQRVRAAAMHLQAFGLKDGDVMAVLAPPSIDFFVLYLAGHRLGAIWLGLNPKYTLHELTQVLLDAKPSLILARPVIGDRHYKQDLHALADLQALATSQFGWIGHQVPESIIPSYAINPHPPGQPHEIPTPKNLIAALVYTSGSTGRPKAARLSHRALIRGALMRSKVWHVSPFRTINNVPINHVGGLGDLACTALVSGGAQVFLETFTAVGTLNAIARHKLTYWYQAPTMFEMCLAEPQAAQMDWSHLQAAIWSGGRASEQLIAKLAKVARRLAVDYSMTESVGAITLSPLTDTVASLGQSVGWPDPERGLRIADPQTATPVQRGEVGEAQILDPWMFDGYRDTSASNDVLSADGWFKTGDLVTVNEDGSWRIVGRCKEMFKSGGYNVYPREVEQAIETYPGVREAVVVEVPDPLYGEVGMAFVTLAGDEVNAQSLTHYCRQRLANYKVPKRIVILPQLPMLPIGKVDKASLRLMSRSFGAPAESSDRS